jgi:hypothetical protein
MLESIFYTKWIFKNIIYVFSYYLKKIIINIRKNIKKKNIYNKNLSINIINNFSKINFKRININRSIQLAGKKFKIIKKINWKKKFKDSEDEERLHRFSWIIDLISKKKTSKKILPWIECEILYWYKSFHKEIENVKTNSLKWEPYTISERISNIFIFYTFLKKKIPKIIEECIYNEAVYLIKNLEFFYDSINNHIINNSRAIYFASLICHNKKFKKISIKIFKSSINKLITKDGFLREGSSHYQLIFHRWIFEIFYFSLKNNNKSFSTYLEKINKKLCSGSLFFTTYNNYKDFPLFGDISPDFAPAWIKDFPKIYLTKKIIKTKYESYNNLLYKITDYKNFKISKYNLKPIYKNSGWFKFKKFDHEIILRFNKLEPINFPGHFHDDLGHFIYSYKNEEVFKDTGRQNYNNSKDFYGNNHNSLTLNKLTIIPKNKKLPIKYSNSINEIAYINSKNKLKIIMKMSGFSRIKKNLNWIREIHLLKSKIIITDLLDKKLKNSSIINYFYTDKISLKKSGYVELSLNKLKGIMKSNIINSKIYNYKAATKQYGKLENINQIKYSDFINFNNKFNKNQFIIDWNT